MKNTTLSSANDLAVFEHQLSIYRQQIDTRIAQYQFESNSAVTKGFGLHSAEAYQSFTAIMSRGGKRIRGALAMEAYRMFGGTNHEVAIQAALIMEMVQAYLLIIDDICDRSDVRRGGPTAHKLIQAWHQQQDWRDDAAHFGQSIATLAAVLGMHEALIEADKLPVEPQVRLAAIQNLNYCLSVTAHGQFNDIFNQVTQTEQIEDIENVLVWKTAFYTFINPLQFGALLAGAEGPTLQALVDFSIHAGRAFQLSDDLIGVFVDGEESGKSPLDDMREGKRTMQIVLALSQASPQDREFLNQALGRQELTMADLQRCRQIIIQTGAHEQVRQQVSKSLAMAKRSLNQLDSLIDHQGIQFLRGLTDYLELRQS